MGPLFILLHDRLLDKIHAGQDKLSSRQCVLLKWQWFALFHCGRTQQATTSRHAPCHDNKRAYFACHVTIPPLRLSFYFIIRYPIIIYYIGSVILLFKFRNYNKCTSCNWRLLLACVTDRSESGFFYVSFDNFIFVWIEVSRNQPCDDICEPAW